MKREDWEKRFHLIKDFIEGETIQYYCDGKWQDIADPSFEHSPDHYRIKPEPKARPFKDCDELISHWIDIKLNVFPSELLMPHIWVKSKANENERSLIIGFNRTPVGSCVYVQDTWLDLEELFVKYTFLDGSPCGITG